MQSLSARPGARRSDQWLVFLMLSSLFCVLGAMTASAAPKGSVWDDHLNSGRLLLSGQTPDNPTYPLWGYSFLAAAAGDRLVWLQAILAVAASTWWFVLISRSAPDRGPGTKLFFPVLVAICLIPWFALATTYFSNSIGVILALFAVCLLWQAQATGQWLAYTAVAGITLGLAANVRSEFLVVAVVLAGCVVGHGWAVEKQPPARLLARGCTLLVPVLLALVPWAAFSHGTTGELRLKSTNSGAVAYLGLGSLPANPWNIVPKDEYVDKLALEAVGSKSAWTAAADKHFSQQYSKAIRDEPAAFVRRVVNGWRVMLMQGFYMPNLRQLSFSDPRDEIVTNLAVEKLKASLSLGVDHYALDRAGRAGVSLEELAARHVVVVGLEAMLRVLGVLLLAGMLGLLVYRLVRHWPYTFAGWTAAGFVMLVFFVAGFIQTSPRHSTLLLPILLGALLLGQPGANRLSVTKT